MDIINVNDYYEVYDGSIFVCSADTYREAEEEADDYLKRKEEMKRAYYVTYFAAKCKWITRDGERLQVPIEDFHHYSKTIDAASKQSAINSIKMPGYIIRNVEAA